MRQLLLLPLLLVGYFTVANPWPSQFANKGFVNAWGKPIEYLEDWGYVTIRTGAHLFYWLYSIPSRPERPLLIWLQGGPGASSTLMGNLAQSGPKFANGTDNLGTWVQVADILYLDSPVGTGFSYTDGARYRTHNGSQVVDDFMLFYAKLLETHPEISKRQLYLFGQSYGGKVVTEIAHRMLTTRRYVDKLKGIILSNSWISPMDHVDAWGTLLFTNGLINHQQWAKINTSVDECRLRYDRGRYDEMKECFNTIAESVQEVAGKDFDWYDFMRDRLDGDVYKVTPDIASYVKRNLKEVPSSLKYEVLNDPIYDEHAKDFWRPVVHVVDQLLAAGVNVTIMNGNRDFICGSLCVSMWTARLKWPRMKEFYRQPRTAIRTERYERAGWYRKHRNLQFYWLREAGHSTATSDQLGSLYVLESVFKELPGYLG